MDVNLVEQRDTAISYGMNIYTRRSIPSGESRANSPSRKILDMRLTIYSFRRFDERRLEKSRYFRDNRRLGSATERPTLRARNKIEREREKR